MFNLHSLCMNVGKGQAIGIFKLPPTNTAGWVGVRSGVCKHAISVQLSPNTEPGNN